MIFRILPILLLSLLMFLFCGTGWAIEVAPRMSDREIIDKLARLEEGQKGIRKEMDQRFESMENSINQRFEAVNQRFESMENTMNQRFESMENSMNQRFTSMENSMNQMFTLIVSLIIVVIGGMFGLVGFIIWDRKTALRPLEKKLDKLEQDISYDLELQRPEGSRLTRLIHAIRELAQEDPKVAKVLQSFSLL